MEQFTSSSAENLEVAKILLIPQNLMGFDQIKDMQPFYRTNISGWRSWPGLPKSEWTMLETFTTTSDTSQLFTKLQQTRGYPYIKIEVDYSEKLPEHVYLVFPHPSVLNDCKFIYNFSAEEKAENIYENISTDTRNSCGSSNISSSGSSSDDNNSDGTHYEINYKYLRKTVRVLDKQIPINQFYSFVYTNMNKHSIFHYKSDMHQTWIIPTEFLKTYFTIACGNYNKRMVCNEFVHDTPKLCDKPNCAKNSCASALFYNPSLGFEILFCPNVNIYSYDKPTRLGFDTIDSFDYIKAGDEATDQNHKVAQKLVAERTFISNLHVVDNYLTTMNQNYMSLLNLLERLICEVLDCAESNDRGYFTCILCKYDFIDHYERFVHYKYHHLYYFTRYLVCMDLYSNRYLEIVTCHDNVKNIILLNKRLQVDFTNNHRRAKEKRENLNTSQEIHLSQVIKDTTYKFKHTKM